ncbi:hypothetical protein COOONC_12463, partial [Cooperia oncophora]
MFRREVHLSPFVRLPQQNKQPIGAAVHVLLAQIDDIMGVRVPKASGIGYIFVRIYDLAVRVPQVNVTTLIISLVSMTFLYVGKEYLSPFLSKRVHLKVPIPYELILVCSFKWFDFRVT